MGGTVLPPWQLTPVFLPGESHGGRSLVGYSPRGRKESDTTERLHFLFKVWWGSSLVAQRLKCLPAMQETWVRSLGWEDPLEKEMATHSRIPAWRIPWTEEHFWVQSTGLQRVRHDWVTSLTHSNYGEDNEDNGDLPSKDPMHVLLYSVPPNLQQVTTDPCLHWRLLDTHKKVWVSLLCTWNNRLVPNRKRSTSRLYIVTLLI